MIIWSIILRLSPVINILYQTEVYQKILWLQPGNGITIQGLHLRQLSVYFPCDLETAFENVALKIKFVFLSSKVSLEYSTYFSVTKCLLQVVELLYIINYLCKKFKRRQ